MLGQINHPDALFIVLGAAFGHMGTVEQRDNFFQFVTAHGPFELTAIVLSAAAGMRLGFSLVDTHGQGVERITEKGVVVDGREYELDCLIYATGFDAMTGALLRANIRGRDGQTLPSGIYFYRLTSGRETATRKMVLAR